MMIVRWYKREYKDYPESDMTFWGGLVDGIVIAVTLLFIYGVIP